MYQKNNKALSILIISLLILIVSVSITFYFSRPQTAALANGAPASQTSPEKPFNTVIPIVQISEDKPTEVVQQNVNQEVLSETQNDITVEITSAKVINTGVEIGVCYTTLDGGDWYPTPGHLFYSTYEIYPDQYGFTTEEKANANKPGKRCVLVYYRIDDLESITTPIQFSIEEFEARPLEMFSACQNFEERLATSPKANAYGLKAKCVENSDGSISATLAGHAASIENDNADKALQEIAQGIVNGPWTFTINRDRKIVL